MSHLHEGYEEAFCSVLGGLILRFVFASACCKSKINEAFVKVHNFWNADKLKCCRYDIQLCFVNAECHQANGKVLIVEQKAIFRQIDDEVFQLADEDQKQINWLIELDKNFSNFRYYFNDEYKQRVDKFKYFIFCRFFLQHTFINHHGLIIHAAGGSINGKGMVFPAVSGTGKSTLSHLLLPFSENQLFSEERIIMRRLDDGWHLWGTPWKGTGSIARNESAPLSALVFLSQAPETKITPLSTSAALRLLLETVSIPWYSQEWTDKGLAVCESLLRDIPAFELAFRPDETAVQAVADFAASLP